MQLKGQGNSNSSSSTANIPGFVRLVPASQYLGISPRTLRSWTYRRLVKCYRPTCRLLLYRIPDLTSAMERFASGGGK